MPLNFRGGQRVRQKTFVIEGEIVDVQIINNEPHYNVAYKDELGNAHARYFAEGELEPAPRPAQD